MSADVIAAWIAATASLGSAGTAWLAQRAAARLAANSDQQAAMINAKTEVYNSDKAIYVEQVTAERGVWRSDLRRETATVVAWLYCPDQYLSTINIALSNIALRLNPIGRSKQVGEREDHPLDRDIFIVIAEIREKLVLPFTAAPTLALKLECAVGPLLKQEWTVSKTEAGQAAIT